MRGTGADQPVVASKPGNAGGAKGLNGSAEGMDQPVMGGIHAGSEVVRARLTRRAGVNQRWEEPMPEAKPYAISKQVVWEAYQKVKANHGAAGVDGQSIEAFETDLKGNLYKIWNRMSSGSYFPPPVRLVEIPKANGGSRPLGIPTVGDRVAQMVVKMHLEPLVEPHFHPDSYGYRPGSRRWMRWPRRGSGAGGPTG